MANLFVSESNDRIRAPRLLWKRMLLLLLISCGCLTSMARADELPSFFDEFAEGLGQSIQRTAPATFPPLISANNLALRVAMPLATEETKPLLEPLLSSGRYGGINHGIILNDAISAIEDRLEEQFPEAIIRPRHISMHITVNLGGRAGDGAVHREREIVSGSISAEDFRNPSALLGPLEIFEQSDDPAYSPIFEDADTLRQLLEHQDPRSQESPIIEFSESESLDRRNEATTFTIIYDVIEDHKFLDDVSTTSSINDANNKVLEWIGSHPVILNAIATYEVIDKEIVEIKNFRRQFEYNGKSWSMLPANEK